MYYAEEINDSNSNNRSNTSHSSWNYRIRNNKILVKVTVVLVINW